MKATTSEKASSDSTCFVGVWLFDSISTSHKLNQTQP